ncbi:MAG: hypothetical protein D8M59_09795 [Planctomycetes bacterium]|nr:hypothetical protein [Planctomycetota bacterium]
MGHTRVGFAAVATHRSRATLGGEEETLIGLQEYATIKSSSGTDPSILSVSGAFNGVSLVHPVDEMTGTTVVPDQDREL